MDPKIEQRLRELNEQEEAQRAAYDRKHPVNRRAVWASVVGIVGGSVLAFLLDEMYDMGGRGAAVGVIVAIFSSLAVYVPVARH